MPIENNIPKEHLVIINGVERDNRSDQIVKDFFTGEWLDLENGNVISLSVPISMNRGILEYRYVYVKLIRNVEYPSFLLQYDASSPLRYNRFHFKDEKEFEKFCEKYDFVKGKNNPDVWFQKKLIKYDRKKPKSFNNTKHKKVVEDYLCGEIYIDEKRVKTKEYKELLDLVNIENQKFGLESSTFKAFEGLQFSYGLELETISGCIYDEIMKKENEHLNVSGVFDGSLRDPDGSGPWGQEYVTGVLKGDSGLKQVYDITKLISKHCEVDERCAFHVHIGSLNWNSEDMVYMYLLGLILEDEIFSIMPFSRRDNEYCKKLPPLPKNKVAKLSNIRNKESYRKSIDGLYDSLFKIVGRAGSPNRFSNKKTEHPKGRHGGYDRNKDHRYSWLNFTNMIFNQRGRLENKTIEFRPHSGTLSYTKIYNWLKICMAIVEYAHIGKKDILNSIRFNKPISLDDIIRKVYRGSNSALIEYIQVRKNLFSDITNENADYINEDINIKNLKELVCA